MWHSDIQSRIIKYRSSKFRCKRESPEDVVDPCVNRFIELFCESNDKTRVTLAITKTIEELKAFLKYLEQISTDLPESRTVSLSHD